MAALTSPGYFSGTVDIYYATFATEDGRGAAPTYSTPILLGKSVEVSITPTYKEGQKYASNSKVRNIKNLDSYEVEITPDAISMADRAAILGREVDSNGVHILNGSSNVPYIALGFGFTDDQGNEELWWLYKGKFGEIEASGSTQEDSIEWTDTVLSGIFDRRIYDDQIGAVVNTGEMADGKTMTPAKWFGKVYEKGASLT